MTEVKELSEGSVFSIPLKDGRFGICLSIWVPDKAGMFRTIFAFVVLSIGHNEGVVEPKDPITFKNYRGYFNVIFGSKKNIKYKEWRILGHFNIQDKYKDYLYFNSGGSLYFKGDYIRSLDIPEYKDYNVMAVSGNDLIQEYLITFHD